MNYKEELLAAGKRILYMEKQMRDDYAMYIGYLSDQDILDSIKEIEADEIRHINMAERILSILQK